MIRVLLFLAALAALALGFSWIADQPGGVSVVWAGQAYEMRLVVALGALLALIFAAMLLWSVLRFVLRIPTLMSFTARMRRRNKAFSALTKGILAASAGDAKTAARAARDAEKLMGDEPLTLLLSAQSAQLAGDRAKAERVFQRMAERPDTQALGLRGLHVEARRRGDDVAAHEYARRAHELGAMPWAGQAMLEKHAMGDDWAGALAVVEANLARKTIDRATANRQRAVLKTAIAQKLQLRDPTEALALAREALKLAPNLTPAAVLAGVLLSRKGDLRRAAKLLEASWRAQPHPDVGRAYVDVRPGDSATDRLARARTLSRLALEHPESRLLVARAALEARDFALARRTMADLVESERRPTVRMCLTMADIEETEHGPSGRMREWLARASRAPRDPVWVADGLVSEEWLPASPLDGRLDAFRWETPVERIGDRGAEDAPPQILWEPSAPTIEPEPEPAPVVIEPEPEPEPTPEPVEEPAPQPVAATVVAAPEPAPTPPPTPAPAPAAAPAPASTSPRPADLPASKPPVPAPQPAAAVAMAEPVTASALKPPTAAANATPPASPATAAPQPFYTAPDDPGPEPEEAPPRRGLFR